VEVPSAVKEYYLSKSPAALVEEVVEHYLSNVWPIANAIIQSRINNRYDRGLVMEGSALLPEQVVSVNHGQCQAIWLTAPPELITERILERSGWHKASNKNQQIISSFLDRSLIFNQQVIDDANRLSQKVMDVSEYQGMDELIDRVAALMLADTKIW
ncbi:MAG: hypothetical protein OEZ23_10200, partial [Gammaproteobacteria bacterium]|nr:hypothetical protein [Gammaproteobacteria bacterium]